MGLLDRVARLLRANLNDLVDRAEDPQKVLKQVILDMQNQLMQLKTQVAIAVADRHLLERKLRESSDAEAESLGHAELAVSKGREDLARTAAEKALAARRNAGGYREQLDDQNVQVDRLKGALRELERKLTEAQARSELLLAQHRRARALGKATDAQSALRNGESGRTLARMQGKVEAHEALSIAKAELAGDDAQEELLALGRQDEIDQILADIRARKPRAS